MATATMNNPVAYKNYQKTQVETASPGKLLLMLYDGAIRKLGDAAKYTRAGNIPDSHINLIKVQDILIELILALNHEIGGEISKNLQRLYEYMYTRLVEANIKRDPGRIEEVTTLMSELREGWQQAILSKESQPQPEPQVVQKPSGYAPAPTQAKAPVMSPASSGLNISG